MAADEPLRIAPCDCLVVMSLPRMRTETALPGWAYRIRTGESVRELPSWICVTIRPDLGAIRVARPFGCQLHHAGPEFARPEVIYDMLAREFKKSVERSVEQPHYAVRPLSRSSIRGHQSKIMFGVLVVVLGGYPIARLEFSLGQGQVTVIASSRVVSAPWVRAGRTRCPPL